MADENWLSTDEMIHEVISYTIKLAGGTMPIAVRCPSKEIEDRVKAYMKGKKNTSNIETYVGGPGESMKAFPKNGEGTRSAPPAKRGKAPLPPVEMTEEEMQLAADEKHDAQMADMTPEDDLGGLI